MSRSNLTPSVRVAGTLMSTPYIAFPIFILYLAATSTISPAVPSLTRLFIKEDMKKSLLLSLNLSNIYFQK